jgi:hypothetical protein
LRKLHRFQSEWQINLYICPIFMQFLTEEPAWYFIFCLLLGLAYATVLYRQNSKEWNQQFNRFWTYVLFAFRALAVTLISALLLNPLLISKNKIEEKPTLLLAVDNSRSMLAHEDSAEISGFIENISAQLANEFGGEFDILRTTFGEKLGNGPITFRENYSDLSSFFRKQEEIYGGRNAYANVLITDGITNRGMNPEYVQPDFNIPTYVIGIGDSSIVTDLNITDVRTNSIAFLGNTFPLEVDVEADLAKNQRMAVQVYQAGKLHKQETIGITKDFQQATLRFQLDANKLGNQRLDIRISPLKEEKNKQNNSKSVYVEVLDGRQKILLLAHGAHPDIGTIRRAIQEVDQYELDVELAPKTLPDLKVYDMVITHQMPTSTSEANLLKSLVQQKKPLWTILGEKTSVSLFNALNLTPAITGNTKNTSLASGIINEGFSLFEAEDPNDGLGDWPPLTVPFGEMAKTDINRVLAYQKIGSVQTENPLWFFSNKTESKVAVLLGEGIWRWQISEQEESEKAELTNGLIRSTIQFTALKEDKRRLKVYTSKRKFLLQEDVRIHAELYNENLEMVEDATINLTLSSDQNKKYQYTLPYVRNSYMLRLNGLPAGSYAYKAVTNYGGQQQTASGSFVIENKSLELSKTVANFGMLRKLSGKYDGQFYLKEDASKLIEDLKGKEDAITLSSTWNQYKDIIDEKWIFFVLLALLSVEWFFRRYTGFY